jgi:murein DD-endopeptidase MepM/ murein hydrolase activator NlpD
LDVHNFCILRLRKRVLVRGRRLAACLLSAALAIVGLTVSTSPAGAAAVPVNSDPTWYPLHAAAIVGCIGDGPSHNLPARGTCSGDHLGYFGLNLDIALVSGVYPTTAGVWAAGGGTVTAVVKTASCSTSSSGGNYVSIDHGGGIVSFYEHLSSTFVKTGQSVRPGTLLGYASNTGAGNCASHPYLDFVVRNDGGGYADLTQVTNTLKACTAARATKPQIWPGDISPGSPSTWIKTTYLKTAVPASVAPCGTSLTLATYATPHSPAVSSTTGKAAVSWGLTKADSTMIQEMIYHPSSKAYSVPCSGTTKGCSAGYFPTGAGVTKYTASGLLSKQTYRFRIARHNGTGWSPWSAWTSVTVK